ncbi:hypothetical protein ACFWP3_26170 [Streptomyces sp. NPDC058525]|uniref:hypothetical protein n=1 Tax=Streptomyces sp. NPDC058525 TaxID=3346538 RepID=UPI0036608510
MAAAYCLSEAGITLADVDEIAFNPAWPTPSDICTDAELIAELLDRRRTPRTRQPDQLRQAHGPDRYGSLGRYTLDFLTARAGGSSRRS